MRRSLTIFALLLLAGVGAFAQSRENVRIYVRSVTDDPGFATYAGFFRQNFADEIEGAGYGLAYRAADSDFILNLTIRPNMVPYEDGIVRLAPPGEKQSILQFSLVRNQDNAEIVAFTFPFTNLADVEPYNQYLFSQVMSNLPYSFPQYAPAAPTTPTTPTTPAAPTGGDGRDRIIYSEPTMIITPGPERVVEVPGPERIVQVEVPGPERIVEVPVPGPERIVEVPVPIEVEVIRQVQVPIEVVKQPGLTPPEITLVSDVPSGGRTGGGVEIVRVKEPELIVVKPDLWRDKWLYLRLSADVAVGIFRLMPEQDPKYNNFFRMMPGATLGLETQFLNWMSFEVDLMAKAADIEWGLYPGAALQLKFPIKPGSFLMLEPYLAAALSLNNAPSSNTPLYLEAGGGFQLGMKGGELGAVFLDLNFLYTLNNLLDKNNIPRINNVGIKDPSVSWDRYVVGLGVGYKFGFVNRRK